MDALEFFLSPTPNEYREIHPKPGEKTLMELQPILDWTEKHAGLGGWIGGIGAVIAIFVTWMLARAEYLRTKRHAAALVQEKIRLINTIVSNFETKIFRPFADKALQNDSCANGWYGSHLNDAEMHGMTDLAHLSVTEWPTINCYAYFKQYWFSSIKILERSNMSPINRGGLETLVAEQEKTLQNLEGALNWARDHARYI